MPMQSLPGRGQRLLEVCLGLHAHNPLRPFRIINDHLGNNAENIILFDMVANSEGNF